MKNGEQPAYPHLDNNGFTALLKNIKPEYGNGLTKREYFAGLAMQGLLASNDEDNYVNNHHVHPETVAKKALQCADALLTELSKTNP